MKANPMLKHILSIMCFIVASFSVQALSHFVINIDHFQSIDFMREDQFIGAGVLAMILQGAILSHLYWRFINPASGFVGSMTFSYLMGAFLAIYIAIVEPAKYDAPSYFNWLMVESSASFVQFTIFGLLLYYLQTKLVKDAR